MSEFFTVDRGGHYGPATRLGLVDPGLDGRIQPLPRDGAYSEADILGLVANWFPDGLSGFGVRYLLTPPGSAQAEARHADRVRNYGIELTWELVRRQHAPDRPSRLQCYFAFESLEQACAFGRAPQIVYRVRCEHHFKADMQYLDFGYQGAAPLFCAGRYWDGAATARPQWEVLLIPPVEVVEAVATCIGT